MAKVCSNRSERLSARTLRRNQADHLQKPLPIAPTILRPCGAGPCRGAWHVAEHSRASARAVDGSGVRHMMQQRASGSISASLPGSRHRTILLANHLRQIEAEQAGKLLPA
jgi:hypothetical protein